MSQPATKNPQSGDWGSAQGAKRMDGNTISKTNPIISQLFFPHNAACLTLASQFRR